MKLNIQTTEHQEFIDITNRIQDLINIKEGICIIYNPHTTSGLTINEGYDPDVKTDMLNAIDELTPKINYKHAEGNSSAHIKTSLMGSSLNLLIKDSKLVLGQWQTIYFCEFDGPRNRSILVEFMTK